MPIEPIKIPQNVYIEDRIVGPLTLRQVLICAVGGGFSYALFASISKTYGTIGIPLQLLVWLPAALSAMFAFVRINDLSMMRLCLLMLERINKPSTRTWTPRRGIIINVRTFHTVAEDKNSTARNSVVEKKTQHIAELSEALDLQPVETVITEKEPVEEAVDWSAMDDEPDNDTTNNPNVISTTRPVNPARISVSAATPGASIDGIAPKTGAVSIFRDVSPA